ncbi:MAG: hypothetical protein HY760_02415, partial [Nitrospirae bacterium]|nr:hypothetical protein [Nitrospirota bacterium]
VTVAWSDNSCVTCHQRPETVKSLPTWSQDLFVHWYGSIHGSQGVTCDKCHGGDPAQAGKKPAHQGIKKPTDSRSPIYFKNLPETCGSCHSGVLQQFTQSRHYKNLKADRLAPTCTTCHGFRMDIGAVTPAQIMGRCTICHTEELGVKPEVVDLMRRIVEEIARTERLVQRSEAAVALARETAGDAKEAEALLKTAQDRLKKSREMWHQFQPEGFRRELEEIQTVAGEAYTAARRAMMQEKK